MFNVQGKRYAEDNASVDLAARAGAVFEVRHLTRRAAAALAGAGALVLAVVWASPAARRRSRSRRDACGADGGRALLRAGDPLRDRRRAHRVPADQLDRAPARARPHPRRRPARRGRGRGQVVRDRDPGRRDPRGARPLPAPVRHDGRRRDRSERGRAPGADRGRDRVRARGDRRRRARERDQGRAVRRRPGHRGVGGRRRAHPRPDPRRRARPAGRARARAADAARRADHRARPGGRAVARDEPEHGHDRRRAAARVLDGRGGRVQLPARLRDARRGDRATRC